MRRIDPAGIITTYAGGGTTPGSAADGGPATSAQLKNVYTVALDPAGHLIVGTVPGLRRVDRTTRVISTIAEPGLLYGLLVDPRGAFYYTDATYGNLFKLTAGQEPVIFAGGGSFVGDGRAANAAILHSPQGLALDAAGNLYIADSFNKLVRRVSAANGTISTIAGRIDGAYAPPQEGNDAAGAVVGFPRDLDFDAAGNLYISDLLNGRVWRITTDGKIRTYAGGGAPSDDVGDNGPATSARIYPIGIALDREGNLFIADSDAYETVPHHRIRRVDARTGIITTIAGSSARGGTGDGAPATLPATTLALAPTAVSAAVNGCCEFSTENDAAS